MSSLRGGDMQSDLCQPAQGWPWRLCWLRRSEEQDQVHTTQSVYGARCHQRLQVARIGHQVRGELCQRQAQRDHPAQSGGKNATTTSFPSKSNHLMSRLYLSITLIITKTQQVQRNVLDGFFLLHRKDSHHSQTLSLK